MPLLPPRHNRYSASWRWDPLGGCSKPRHPIRHGTALLFGRGVYGIARKLSSEISTPYVGPRQGKATLRGGLRAGVYGKDQ
jgi:hypothetical protein